MSQIELSRRDAVKALIGGGIISAGIITSPSFQDLRRAKDVSEITKTDLSTLKSVASVVYPS